MVCFAVGIPVQFAKPQWNIPAQTYTSAVNISVRRLHSFEDIVSQLTIFPIQIEIDQDVGLNAVLAVAIEFAVKPNEGRQMQYCLAGDGGP
tara:strand:+ start:211 stop:483 length:273 start_codon:yes stop_codon:yes gene_type:complete